MSALLQEWRFTSFLNTGRGLHPRYEGSFHESLLISQMLAGEVHAHVWLLENRSDTEPLPGPK